MMISSPMMTPPRGKKKGDSERNNTPRGAGPKLSPLSCYLWGDGGTPPRNNPLNNGKRSSFPSPRRAFKLEKQGPENIENDNKKASRPTKRGKRKCTKQSSSPKKEERDACNEINFATADMTFSRLFPEMSSAVATGGSSSSKNCRKSILLGPRLRRRPAPIEEKNNGSSSSSENALAPPPGKNLSIELAGKSPEKRKMSPPRQLRRSPRKSNKSASISKHHLSPMSPLHPPRSLPRTSATNSDKYFGDFAMTPTILYDGSNGNNGQGRVYNRRNRLTPMSATATPNNHGVSGSDQRSRHYHQSPHWSGQVRVNPFSPVPEKYLRPPPTSTKSATRGSKRHYYPGRYPGIGLPALTTGTSGPPSARKRRRPNPRPARCSTPSDDVSPTDVTQALGDGPVPTPRRGRYLSDFQEVGHLGAGSFGSVNACLSRLDGCTYAVKSVGPAARGRGSGGRARGEGPARTHAGGANYLYGGMRTMSNQCAIPPTPGRDSWSHSPLRRRKAMSRFANEADATDEDCGYDLGVLEGSSHWNDGALRRMLREVFALAALCQQDDVRTFHVVRYQQAWLEEDGTLYIQTELCSATLRDEMQGKRVAGGRAASDGDVANKHTCGPIPAAAMAVDAFRQCKVLREVLLALELVHQRGMVHLDIKPENIMVKNDLYKLGDFGLANSFTKNEGKGDGTAITPDIEEGDSRYMSKDLLDFGPKDLTKCDIFSLGATMYEVCTGRPLPSCGQEWQDLRNGRLPWPFPSCTMPRLAAVVREMMHPDPERRPSASQLLSREVLDFNGREGAGNGGISLLLRSARKRSSYEAGPATALKRSASWSF